LKTGVGGLLETGHQKKRGSAKELGVRPNLRDIFIVTRAKKKKSVVVISVQIYAGP